MKFGLQLPIQAQSSLFAADWERSASVEDFATVARCVDDAGFDYIGVCDHIAIPERLAGAMSTTWYDNVATLGWLAAITTRIRLLSHVHIVAYRHPAQTAHAFATLDHLSGGRIILGVGAGHVEEEFELFGIDFHARGSILDDRIDRIKAYLASEFVDGMGSSPRPRQDPRPPIWVGGSSSAAIRRAALAGEGWLPQGTPKSAMPQATEMIQSLRAQHGRTGDFAIGSITEFLHIGENSSTMPKGTIVGTPERMRDEVASYASLGVTHLQVRFGAASVGELCDQVQAFGEIVGTAR